MGGTVTARDIIIATGSVPFVPPGIPIDGKTVRPASHSGIRAPDINRLRTAAVILATLHLFRFEDRLSAIVDIQAHRL